MTVKEKLILFLVSCDPGIRDIYKMTSVFERADFPSELGPSLNSLLKADLIYVTKYFDDGAPFVYGVTEKGRDYLIKNFNNLEIINFVKSLQNPQLLLQIVQVYVDKRNNL